VSTLIVMLVLMPWMRGEVVIKVNLGKGESPREAETTAGEEGESERSEGESKRSEGESERSEGESERSKENRIEELPAMPKIKAARDEVKMPKGGQAWISKCAEVLISAELRVVPCD